MVQHHHGGAVGAQPLADAEVKLKGRLSLSLHPIPKGRSGFVSISQTIAMTAKKAGKPQANQIRYSLNH